MNEAMYNGIDPYHKSKFKVSYDISGTPQIYVLDREKKIVSKRIAGDQLDEVVGRMVEIMEKRELDQASGGR